MTEPLFHIAVAAEWGQRRDSYVPSRFAEDGFIHCSTSTQLPEVAVRLFRGRDDLVLLTIDPDRVGPEVRYENLEGGREQYPHIYGPLNPEAVLDSRPLRIGADGS